MNKRFEIEYDNSHNYLIINKLQTLLQICPYYCIFVIVCNTTDYKMDKTIKTYEMNDQIEQVTNKFGLYLRRQRTKDTLYITVCHLGQVYKIPTGICTQCGEIRARRWDSRNGEIMKKIMNVRLLITELMCNFADADILTIKNEIINNLNISVMNNSPKTRTPRASKVIKEVFDKNYTQDMASYGTYLTYLRRYISYLEYIKETDKRNGGDSLDKFKLEWIIDFRNWLSDNGLKPQTINTTVNFIVATINNYIAEDRRYMKYVAKIAGVTNIKQKITDKMVKSLNIEQINKFFAYTPTDKYEYITYDIFKLLILTGLRISDLQQILDGEYIQGENNTIAVKTKKKKTTANVILTKEVKELIDKYTGYHISKNYNEGLKKLFKNILPDDVIEYDEQNGRTVKHVETQLYNVITAHWGRHTMITYNRMKGEDIEKIRQQVGHSTDKMINQVYSHLNIKDENKLFAQKYTENPLKNKVTVIDKSKEYLKENMDNLVNAVKMGYGEEYLEVMEEMDEMDNINGDTL